jgi:hypothetical protein
MTDGGIVLRHATGAEREYVVTHDGTTYRFRRAAGVAAPVEGA